MIDKNTFGKPSEGIHSYKINDVAVFDVAMTFGASYFISKQLNSNFINTSVFIFLSGVAVHKYFGVETGLNKKIFN